MKRPPEMSESEYQGLLCYDLLGNKSYLTFSRLLHKITHRYYIAFMLMLVLLFILFDLHGYRAQMPFSSVITLWFLFIVTLGSVYSLILAVAVLVSKRFHKFFIVAPVFGLLSMSAATLTETYLCAAFTSSVYSLAIFTANVLTNLAIGAIFLIAFDVLLAVRIRDGKPVLLRDSLSRISMMSIAGKKFEVSKVLMMSAQDHYIEVQFSDSTHLERGRLVDAVDQMTDVDGIVPHRSYWVSRKAVIRLERGPSGLFLRLRNGGTVPVARSRATAVRDWLDN